MASERRDSIAVVDGDRRLTYGELLDRADALAAEINRRGIGPSARVGILLPRSTELVVAVVGVARSGAAYVPVDAHHPPDRCSRVLDDAAVRLVITDSDHRPGLPIGTESIVGPFGPSSQRVSRPHPNPDDVCYVIYTSGSTGVPNGVAVTQHNLSRLFTSTEALYGFGPDDVWALFHSISFDVSVWELWGSLLYGGRLLVVPTETARSADLFHGLVLRNAVTVLCQTPSAFRAFDAADELAGRPTNHLRHVVFAGESLDPRTLAGWFAAHGDERPCLSNMYGITETTVHVTWRRMRIEDARGDGRSLIGQPLPDLRIELRDAEGSPVADGEVGEIWVGGAGVAQGYIGRPELTARRFLPDPGSGTPGARLYRSGDLARRLPDDELEYLGRADQQVKIRGYRVELGEVESALRTVPGIVDAVVALQEDAQAGPRLVAYVVSKEPLDRTALRERLSSSLPSYMVPAAHVRLDRVPRTINDKVDRRALPAPCVDDFPQSASGGAPVDEVEREIARLFAEILGVAVADREADFFRLGGHSLLALRLAVECQRRFAVPVSGDVLFRARTVVGLADHVRRAQTEHRTEETAPRLSRASPVDLSPAQRALLLELQLRPTGDAYHERLEIRIETAADPGRLRAALARLAEAHEVLRSRIVEVDGEPRMAVDLPAEALEFEEGDRDPAAFARRPFDLARGPLWRTLLHREPDGRSVLLLVVHHLVVDAASQEILVRDLLRAYERPDESLPAREYDFGDFAAQECRRLAVEGDRLRDFWAQVLSGADLSHGLPPPLSPCPAGEEPACVADRRELGPELSRQIRDLAANWGVTRFHVHLAAFAAVLGSRARREDLVVGTPASLRDTPVAERVVGYALSPVVVRLRVEGARTFRDTVLDIARRWRDAWTHGRLPLDAVLRAAGPAAGPRAGSPVQAFLTLMRQDWEDLRIEGRPVTVRALPPEQAKFGLLLTVVEQGESASLVLEGRRDTIDPGSARGLLLDLDALLRGVVQHPGADLDALRPGEPSGASRASPPEPRAPTEATPDAPGPAGDSTGQAVSEAWVAVLGVRPRHSSDNFFALGGHSLLAIRLASECQKRLGRYIPGSAVFENPTVAGLAAWLARGEPARTVVAHTRRVSRAGPIDLSPAQRALWLDLTLGGREDLYNESLVLRTESPLEPERLRRALTRLAEAHEVLRSRIVAVDGEPRMAIDLPAEALEFEEGEQDPAAFARRPFDLACGPLWRTLLRREPDGGSTILLVVHHLIVDAASQEILVRDLLRAYERPDESLPTREYDFADFAAEECRRLEVGRQALEAHWAKNLAGADLSLDLPPPCVPCPPSEADTCVAIRRDIGSDLDRRVRELAAEWGVTPFVLHLAAFATLLRTYAGREDLVIGSPLSLRDSAVSQEVVGYALNPLPVRLRVEGRRTFRETVLDGARSWQETRANGRLPLDAVLRAAGPASRRGAGSPVQVFFSLVEDPWDAVQLEGRPVTVEALPPQRAKFGLYVALRQREGGATLELECRRDALDPEMAARLLRHLETLLRHATGNPEWVVEDLPLIDDEEAATLRNWGGRTTPYPRDRTVHDLFAEAARERGEATALVAGGTSVSYRSLDRRSNAVAEALREHGVGRGSRVGLLLPRGARFVACALGVLKCGAAFVPLDPVHPAGRLRQMLAAVAVSVGLREAGAPEVWEGVRWIDAAVADRECDLSPPFSEVPSTDPAYVMFTSGSTGQPNGVEVPHRGIVRLVRGQDYARMGADTAWLHLSPTSFDASTLEIWTPLLNGGRCVVVGPESPGPDTIARAIRDGSADSAWLTATLFNTLVDEAPECLRGLRQILVGGETLSPPHVRRAMEILPGVRLINGYGPTENTTFTCCQSIRPEDVGRDARSIPIGRPIANTTVRVVDRSGRVVPIGVPGELVTGGDGVALGYVNDPDLTAQRFVAEPSPEAPTARFYRTGDRVRWQPDGLLEFLGRLDEQLKIRGHRIEPAEVEAALGRLPGVRQCAVAARGECAQRRLIAWVVPEAGTAIDGVALRRELGDILPSFMVPAAFVSIDALPRRETGKIDVTALPDPARGDRSGIADEEVEQRLRAIWEELLEHRPIGRDDDFFALGGHSLLGIRLVGRVNEAFGVDLPFGVIYHESSLQRMAALLREATPSNGNDAVQVLRTGDSCRPLFLLPGLGGRPRDLLPLARRLRTAGTVIGLAFPECPDDGAPPPPMEEIARVLLGRIRSVQPRGPFRIAGYSLGGMVAFEIAQQLSRAGEEVELLAILDAFPGRVTQKPLLARVALHWRRYRQLPFLGRLRYLGQRLGRVVGRLGSRARSERRERPGSVEERKWVARQSRELRALRRALDEYTVREYSGRIVLLRTRIDPEWVDFIRGDPYERWRGIARGGVVFHQLSVGHREFMHEPHVQELAADLQEHLDGLESLLDGGITP